MSFSRIFITLISIFSLNNQFFCNKCPALQMINNPKITEGYIVYSFLRIPKTNILIINTSQYYNPNTNIVYYYDMSSGQGEVINIVIPDFFILNMEYNQLTDQFVISNKYNLIFAELYTLKTIYYISINSISSLKIIKDTNLIILTNNYNILQIFDFQKYQIALVMDNTQSLQTFPDNSPLYQYYSDIYKLSSGDFIIVTVNDMGVITWSIDLINLTYKFNGYIPDSQVQKGDNTKYFAKHLTLDILFIVGQYFQVQVVKIQDIKNGQYLTIYKDYIYYFWDSIFNILYDEIIINDSREPIILVSTNQYLAKAQVHFNEDFTKMEVVKTSFTWFTIYYKWYKIEESPILFMSSQTYITIYNYENFDSHYYIYFGGDSISRRFIRQNGVDPDLFILMYQNQIRINERGNFGQYSKYVKPYLSGNIRQTYCSFFQVKNIFDWYLIKSGEDGSNSLIFTVPIFPISQSNTQIDITSSYGLYWIDINFNLDPFYLFDKIFVALAFPNKKNTENYLFQLINCQSTTERYYLTSNSSDVRNIQTVYALASLEDKKNLELIGVDSQGTVYVWDLSSLNLTFKYYQKYDFCQNSFIGDVFHYLSLKRLIIACSSNKVYSLDFVTGDYQYLAQLSYTTLALRAFSSPQLIAIGEYDSGAIQLWKFNQATSKFDLFLSFKLDIIQDALIYFDMSNDYTLWIQYSNLNIFYSIKDCLTDSSLCKQCTQQYYFNTTNSYDRNSVYGVGTFEQPFTSSYNFISTIIKAQFYKQIVSGVFDMSVSIFITPDNQLNLNPSIMNFGFNSIISLGFNSTEKGTYASIGYQNTLQFDNFNRISFQDIIINFNFTKANNSCGILFQNILLGAFINNIQLYNINQNLFPKSCQSIQAISTQLNIGKYIIQNEDFSNHLQVITQFNSSQIFISNFYLINCTLGPQFSIFQQQTDIKASLTNIVLSQNKCFNQTNQVNNSSSALFSAGLFSVDGFQIINNSFCQKTIFDTIATAQQNDSTFFLNNITLINNQFQTSTTYILFNALYQMRAFPSHQLNVSNLYFDNNKIIKFSSNDTIDRAQYFETSKIASINSYNVTIKNQLDIQFGLIQISNVVNFTLFECYSDDNFYNNSQNIAVNGCLSLKEIASTIINNAKFYKKRLKDSSLLSLENKSLQFATISILTSSFSDLVLFQTNENTQTMPVYLVSNQNLQVSIDKCLFQKINLQSIQFTQTYSVTGLWILDYAGSVQISNSQFKDSYSNSQYGFGYIQVSQLSLDTVVFNNSSFVEDDSLSLYNQYGGMLNIRADRVNLLNCNFSNSTAQKGSFLYMVSSNETFNILFTNISFSYGFALLDGGAFFIDTNGYYINFKCENCQFSNLYIYQPQASIIGIQQNSQNQESDKNFVIFDRGYINNTIGIQENYFLTLSYAYIQFININQSYYDVALKSRALRQFLSLKDQQQSTLINIINSQASLIKCSISNLQIKNKQSQIPLLIQSYDSVINLINSSIQRCQFVRSVINLVGGQLFIDNTIFQNIYQFYSKRILFDLNENKLITQSNSLIITNNTSIQILNNSKFEQLKCDSCNGAALQVINGNINIQDSIFNQTTAQLGGAIFITGLVGNNYIRKTIFVEGQSQYNGGSLYFQQQQQQNPFSLDISECQYLNNTSIDGKGGSLYISSNSLNPLNMSISVYFTDFINNLAQIGGAIYNQNISIQVYNSQFMQNYAKIFGSNSISYPTKLLLVNIEQFLSKYNGTITNNQIIIQNFRSGHFFEDIQFQMINDFGEVIIPVSYEEKQSYRVQVRINQKTKNSENYQITGELDTSFNRQSQLYTFSKLYLVGTPNSSVIIQFYSNQIYNLEDQTNQYIQTYSYDIIVNFRECISGEQIKQYNSLTQCDICKKGQYSLNIQQCQDCPIGAECLGGNKIEIKEGFWRRSQEIDLILSCENQKSNCIGGSYGNQICQEGHIGALCEECDINGDYWGESYSQNSKYSCQKCSRVKNNIWILTLITIWTQLSMAIAIKENIKNLEVENAQIQKAINKQRNKLKSAKMFETKLSMMKTFSNTKISNPVNIVQKQKKIKMETQRNKNQIESQSIYLKILTNYFQIVSCVSTFNLTIPSGIIQLPQSVGNPIKLTMNSLDCLLIEIQSDIPIIYFRLVFSQIIPIIYILIIFLGLLIKHLCQKRKNNLQQFPYYALSTACLFLIIFIQPDLVTQFIALISCRTIGDRVYILSNVSYECFTEQHIKYMIILVVPLLIFWVLIIPLVLFTLLVRKKSKLDDSNSKLNLGFLYKEYKNSAYFWEFIKMAEKLSIILVLNFYSQTITVKGILIFIIISLYGILTSIVEPFKQVNINQIDIQSTNVCSITILLAIFMNRNPFSYFYYPSFGILVLINFIFIIFLLKLIMTTYLDFMKSQIQNLASQYSDKFNFLKKFQRDSQVTKKLNPNLKLKVQRAFQNYLNMNQTQRKQIFINIFEKQLNFKSKSTELRLQYPNTIQSSIILSMKSQDIQQERNSLFLVRDTNLDLAFNTIKTNNYQNLQGIKGLQQQTQQN
ncbi:transmembrane protein, putative (macronuclear) [Tetrahymena thermophila SB210]|uniref:Transmembrane protein, putative n=1 Tax=Tetrahymena thermophila (strain SB210) TaxID=312017 RepID=Q23JJ6_TETTS|nr:transmembrane protein, putative [Tetrahymena thermophila SB210]EAR96747.2 transmembrane protein, putative [Tetrahymena thermophila SB210]|eukprot:XP_001016992.2 transmembrane protein, putative [Tetrahymena thermophila SB210]